jgi:hypothetical protein
MSGSVIYSTSISTPQLPIRYAVGYEITGMVSLHGRTFNGSSFDLAVLRYATFPQRLVYRLTLLSIGSLRTHGTGERRRKRWKPRQAGSPNLWGAALVAAPLPCTYATSRDGAISSVVTASTGTDSRVSKWAVHFGQCHAINDGYTFHPDVRIFQGRLWFPMNRSDDARSLSGQA